MNMTLKSFSPHIDGDGFYDVNLDCRWIIYRQTKKTLHLLIRGIDIEYSEGCRFDYMKVGGPYLHISQGRAIITEHCLPMTPGGKTNTPRQTVHKSRTKENQINRRPLPQQGDHNSRPDPVNTTGTKQRKVASSTKTT